MINPICPIRPISPITYMIRNTRTTMRAIFLGTAIIAVWGILGLNDAEAGTILQRPLYFGLNQGLVGYWSFDAPDMAGVAAYDRSGNNNNGTLTNGPVKTIGKIGQGMSFDGVNDWIDGITQPAIQTSPNRFTIVGILNPGNQTSRFITPNSAGIDHYIQYDPTNQRLDVGITEFADINNRLRSSTSGSMPIDTWTHWAVSINDKNIRIYINGVLNSEFNESIDIADWTGNWRIGQRGNSTLWYKGKLDEVRVYNRALSPDEIRRLYNMGATTKFNVSKKQDPSLNQGLVGLWTFDAPDMAGVTAYDKSGNNNNGTLTNGVKKAIGKIGQALNFDGSDDYVTFNANIPTENSTFTASMWVNPISGSGVFTKHNASGASGVGNQGFFLNYNLAGGRFYFYQYNSSGTYTSLGSTVGSALANQWVHYTMVRDVSGGNATITIYINGVRNASGTVNNIADMASQVLTLGKYSYTSAAYFNGLIDEVRVYNRALSPDEIKRLYNMGATTKFNVSKKQDPSLNQGLVGLWTFDAPDMAGVTAYDKSGNNNNGTLTNGVKKAIGKIGQALNFDGVNDYVSVADDSSLRMGTNSFAIVTWVNPASGGSAEYFVLRKSTAGQYSFSIYPIATTRRIYTYISDGTNSSNGTTGNSALPFDQWTHVVVMFNRDEGKVKVYLNGKNDGERDISNVTGAVDPTSSLNIGYYNGGTYEFRGLIDDVRVYNRALTPDEIKRLYNMGR